MKKEWKIWVDTGGTFTDCLAESPNGKIIRQKVLSSSCLRGTLTAINSPVEINFQLPQITPAQFTLGQSIRILGEESEYIKIIDQPTPNTLHLEKPLKSKTDIGESIEILFDLEAPILAARLATSSPPNKPLPPLTMHLATTKGTNALLEEKGADVTLFITR
ncbi:MAG: 5-oxoprolinase, partial [Verrucomicrobiota bacterium]|nr:5-oxoprolinase [Verrucomicrobiota bacterium]